MKQMQSHHYQTSGGITVYRASMGVDGQQALNDLACDLDEVQGVLLSSSFEYPGRYGRWDIGFSAPPLRLTSKANTVTIDALNKRGRILLLVLQQVFAGHDDLREMQFDKICLKLYLLDPESVVFEEDRSRKRSVFSILRQIISLFTSDEDDFLGLYGAFGYDLCFQFEDVEKHLSRSDTDRELVLYLPDSILVVDHKREISQQHSYDFVFTVQGQKYSTEGVARDAERIAFVPATEETQLNCDHLPGEYAKTVGTALKAFQCGELFEVVPTRTFSQPCGSAPSAIYHRLQKQNPAPYGALMNLGESEYLVAASPEMYVRVLKNGSSMEVETSPISGTIARGQDALEDAQQIQALLNSKKDEAELSMCTDVDRNDKSRVCVPGTVKVTGRRLIEMYSKLIHTVDHVKGILKPELDALDAFLSHTWAVTVTGAPKHAAIQFIEEHERSARHWYGGAIGSLNFNGELNTGLTIRTIRICDGQAQIRAGATLLSDSDPVAEEAETALKASALIKALLPEGSEDAEAVLSKATLQSGNGLSVVMVDHQDSFVHSLSAYLRQSGADVRTVRPEMLGAVLKDLSADLLVLSPGPGCPERFEMNKTIELALHHDLPVFGVCLGLQGIVEYFGGSLRTLDTPMHGKASVLQFQQGPLFEGLPDELQVGRYHSLVADQIPDCLQVTAFSEDGAVMAVQHQHLPVYAVQFHPESILSAKQDAGRLLLDNLLAQIRRT